MRKWLALGTLIGLGILLFTPPKHTPRKKKKVSNSGILPEKQMIDILDRIQLENQAIDDSNVLALSDSTLTEAIERYKYLLVEFYAPRCRHSRALIAEYERTANILKSKGSCAKIAKIDSTVERVSRKTYSIKKYPTLLYFENGKVVEEYPGRKIGKEISGYMMNKVNRAENLHAVSA